MRPSSRTVKPHPEVQTCILPVPPSANQMKLLAQDRVTGKMRLFNTAPLRAFKQACQVHLAKLEPYPRDVPVAVGIVWYQSVGNEGDLDNRVKAALDVLTGHAYQNDVQVRRLTVEVERARGKVGTLAVTISAIGGGRWFRSDP